jgi:hypothetical protein
VVARRHYGGAALPGRFGGRDVTIRYSYEAVGAVCPISSS